MHRWTGRRASEVSRATVLQVVRNSSRPLGVVALICAVLVVRWLYSVGTAASLQGALTFAVFGLMLLVGPRVVSGISRCLDRVQACKSPARKRIIAEAAAVGLAIELGFALAVSRPPGFDAGAVFAQAADVALPGRMPFAPDPAYFAAYPNNLPTEFLYASLDRLLAAFGVHETGFLIAAVLLNALLLTVAVVVIVATIGSLAGRRSAIISGLFCAGFLLVSPWVATPYTDVLGLACIAFMLGAAPFLHKSGWGGVLAWVGFGALSGVAYEIKPTTVFVAVAIGGWSGWHGIRRPGRRDAEPRGRTGLRRRTRHAVSPLLALAVGLGVFVGTPSALDQTGIVPFSIANNKDAVPLAHFLDMGAGTVSGQPGTFSQADVDAMFALPPSERSLAAQRGYVQRVRAMGPFGYARFLAKKIAVTFSDGSFGQWAEGGQTAHPYELADPLSRSIQSVYDQYGRWHWLLLASWRALWWVLLFRIARSLVRRVPLRDLDWPQMYATAILALVAFQALFETRPRYVYLYIPLFVVIAAFDVAPDPTIDNSNAKGSIQFDRHLLRRLTAQL